MREREVKQIVREEVRKVLKESGIELNESKPKRGDKVDTPHGPGNVLWTSSNSVRVRLAQGATMNINRSKVVVKN